MMPDPISFQSSFFSIVHDGDVFVATINRDRLTDEDNLEQFHQDFSLLIEKHEVVKFVLRMSRLRYLTSSAIGKLITLHRKVNRLGGTLVLCELTSDVLTTLEAARLLTYFTNSKDLTGAMAMFEA